MAQTLLSNQTWDFWKKVQKVNQVDRTLPNMVDQVVGDSAIADLFASKYETLHIYVSYDEYGMQALLH